MTNPVLPFFRAFRLRRVSHLAVLCPVILAMGCGGPASPGAPSSPHAGTGEGNKTLTIATADNVQTVDPSRAYDEWSTAVVHACTRRLVDYDAQGKIVG